ncbi:MAG: T9SS type A sorting domain-containing protein [Bacteroidales bacterium]|jgi:1,4-alpha-glucan branching enzyme|nr:T9SS type A sorting domain-containing protein [Bacteroidales bacterium]
MKKLTLSFCIAISCAFAQAQVVTTTPSIVTTEYSGEVQVIFNAAEGNKGLIDYAGEVYAHAGVITDKSTGSSDWKYAPAWGDNAAKYKLQSLGNNLWKLIITPNMREYYGVVAGDTIKKLAFVFRSGDNSKEGKDVGNADIFVDVISAQLSVSFESPSQKTLLINKNETLTLTANAILSTSLSISVNGTPLQTTAASTLSLQYTFNTEGNYDVVASATDGANTVTDTVFVCVTKDVQTSTRPDGLQDGITVYYGTDSASFSLYAQGKANIFLIGDFNNWNISNDYLMKKDGDYFWMTIHGLQANTEYAFQYLVDGTIRVGDPYCTKILDPWNDKYITSSVYPNLQKYPSEKTSGTVSVFSTATDVYAWQNNTFVRPPKEQLIIYELLFRDFTEQGTVKAAEAKLDYLKELGVNAIEIMPIMEFDGNDSWGYNPTFYFAPDKAYGTPNDYKHFIDECHKRGIAVILDVVFNHCWGESPLAKMWWDDANNRPAANSPYANPIAKHPYNVGNDLNHESQATRKYFKRSLDYWLKEYRIDGYRFDLSKGLTQVNSGDNVSLWGQKDTSRINILEDYYQAVKSADAGAYMILEHFAENSEETILANDGMILWNNLNNSFCQSAMGHEDGSSFSGLIKSMPGWVGYMESHDEERVGYKTKTWGNWNMAANPNMRALRAGLSSTFLLLAPGPKMIWQFGEMNYDISIDENGRTGRKPTHWEYLDSPDGKYVHSMYSNIMALRGTFSEVFSGVSGTATFTNSIGSLTSLRKYTYTSDVINMVLLGNFSGDTITTTVALPETGKVWYDYLRQNSAGIAGTSPTISVPPHRFLLLIDTLTPLVADWNDLNVANETVVTATSANSFSVYPNPTMDELTVICKNCQNQDKFKIYSMHGKCMIVGNIRKGEKINVSTLPKGMYILELNAGRTKFIKQ